MEELIHTNSNVLLKLINDILDLSRIESGKISFDFSEVDIVKLCMTVFATAKRNNKNRYVEYVQELKVDKLVINTDENRLRQVMINLLSNAAKCTESGSITTCLEVDSKRRLAVFSRQSAPPRAVPMPSLYPHHHARRRGSNLAADSGL